MVRPLFDGPFLIALTDRTLLSPNWALAQAIAPAVTGGCNLVLLRETDLPANHRMTIARFVLDGIKGRVPMVVEDDVDLAARIGAAGAHRARGEFSVSDARRVLGEPSIVGVTIRSREDAEAAAKEGPDYLLIEYDWSAPERVLNHLRAIADAVEIPIVAGTDMDVRRVEDALNAGARGIAICASVMGAYDRTAACSAYAQALSRDHAAD